MIVFLFSIHFTLVHFTNAKTKQIYDPHILHDIKTLKWKMPVFKLVSWQMNTIIKENLSNPTREFKFVHFREIIKPCLSFYIKDGLPFFSFFALRLSSKDFDLVQLYTDLLSGFVDSACVSICAYGQQWRYCVRHWLQNGRYTSKFNHLHALR